MHFLANENIPKATITALREAGHDVYAISEISPGITDAEVMQRAHEQQRIIITFDRDYGELVFRHRHPLPAGILFLRFTPRTPVEPAEFIEQILTSGIPLKGHFSTADRDQLRQRPISPTKLIP